MVDMALHERALEIWDSARATLESGDRSDLSRLQIEDAFALFEEEIERLRARVGELDSLLLASYAEVKELRACLSRAEEALASINVRVICSQGRGAADPNVVCYCPNCDRSLDDVRALCRKGIAGEVTKETKNGA